LVTGKTDAIEALILFIRDKFDNDFLFEKLMSQPFSAEYLTLSTTEIIITEMRKKK
jgi:hypothetical protein